MSISWVEKYRPSSIKEMIGSGNLIRKVMEFLKKFKIFSEFAPILTKYRNSPKDAIPQTLKEKCERILKEHPEIIDLYNGKRGLLLVGASGIGKTTVVHAIANDLKMDVLELNASDVRTKDSLSKKLQNVSTTTSILQFIGNAENGRIILFDEIDGGSGNAERGGMSIIHAFIKDSNFPVILTANNNDKKLNPLRDVIDILEVPLPSSETIQKYIESVAKKEGIECDPDACLAIAIRSNGDFRAALNDFQIVSRGKTHITSNDVFEIHRDVFVTPEEGIKNMFKSETLSESMKCLDQIDFDYFQKMQNISAQLFSLVDPKQIPQALELILYADQMLTFIMKTQNYSVLPYFFTALSGLCLYGKEDNTNITIRKPIWKAKKTDSPTLRKFQLIFKLPSHTIAKEIVPLLKTIFMQSSDFKKQTLKKLKITEKEWSEI